MEKPSTANSSVILAGGSGFLGKALLPRLLERYERVVILTRKPSLEKGRTHFVNWDGKRLGSWEQWLDGADAIINFTGRSVNCRKTPENRREILESRVDSVRVLATAWKRSARPPRRRRRRVRHQ